MAHSVDQPVDWHIAPFRMPVTSTSNVIDLMAALKKSLGQMPAEQPATPKRKKVAGSRQTRLKLPIKGGKVAADRVAKAPAPPAKPVRKRA